MEAIHIGLCGILAAGKTTLATALGKKLNKDVFYEEVEENPYLAKFYKDMGKYAFPMQIYLLNRRFKQHQTIKWSESGGIQDRTIYEDKIFARMLNEMGYINDLDLKTYLHLFSNMSNFMKQPDVIIYLKLSPEESKKRLDKRSRDCESQVSLDYLKDLARRYDAFAEVMKSIGRVITIDMESFDGIDAIIDDISKDLKELDIT